MFSLNCRGQLATISTPMVMGILNVTPDSFYSGSRHQTEDLLLKKAEKMITEGAGILDLGGQSTRPNSQQVSEEEESDRVLPAIESVNKNFPDQLISVDTFYASVARQAISAGACIVNDVSAGSIDDQLLSTVAQLNVPYILMHMKGLPSTMQQQAQYKDVTLNVFDALNHKLDECTRLGIKDIIIDPGFGFGKTIEHNFTLLRQLSYFSQLNRPIMVGLSRKATVYKSLGNTAEEALNGTTVLHTIALLNGASILRVHDVREAMEAVELTQLYQNKKNRN